MSATLLAIAWIVAGHGQVRVPGEVDLAAIGGESDAYGSGDDAGPASAAFTFAGGPRLGDVELLAHASLGFGGPALGDVERRYFDSDEQSLGSSLNLEGGLMVLYAPAVGERWTLLVGPVGAWQNLTASSPAGHARLQTLRFGGVLGARLALWPRKERLAGFAQVLVDGSLHVPWDLDVGGSPGLDSADAAATFPSFAVVFGYGVRFGV